MKKEDLLKAMSEIDSDLLKSSEYKKNKNGWIKWAAIAAGLVLVLFAVANMEISPNQSGGQKAERRSSQENSQLASLDKEAQKGQETDSITEDGINSGEEAEYVDINGILAKAKDPEAIYSESLELTMLERDGLTCVYEHVTEINSDTLAECLGTQLDESNWYYLAGHSEMQYLIKKKDATCELWKFAYCENEEYSYGDILKKMYGIHSYADIAKIIVDPSTINNTDEGKKLQEQIGTKEITEESQIRGFYEILSSCICYGDNNWDMIGLGDDTESGMKDAVTQVRDRKSVV